MLRYHVKHWEENARRGSDCRSMLFSAPDHFNMTGGSDRRLRVASAAFPGIGTSLLSVISSGHEIDLADDDFLTIMLPTRGVTQVRVDRKGHVVREGRCWPSARLSGGRRWTGAGIETFAPMS